MKKMSLLQFRRWAKKTHVVYAVAYPGNMSRNWDGTWWMVQFCGCDLVSNYTEHVTISASKRWDGLAYCRSKALAKAWCNIASKFEVEITDQN